MIPITTYCGILNLNGSTHKNSFPSVDLKDSVVKDSHKMDVDDSTQMTAPPILVLNDLQQI